MAQSNNFELKDTPDDAISSVNYSPVNPTQLLVSSWDQTIRLYDTHAGAAGTQLAKIAVVSPMLDACYVGDEGREAVCGGLDSEVKLIELETQKETVIGEHQDAVKAVCYNSELDMIISGSWDQTLNLFDRTSKPLEATSIKVPHKVFSLSTVQNKLVVGMSNRAVHIYDLRSMAEPYQRRESSLKFMTRTVRCMPNGEGYATSSIEGRVAVEFFDPSRESQSRKYAFKCHRQPDGDTDLVYPVNALGFHPIYGTFASGGGDGVVSLWDGAAKRRLKQYQKYPASVASLSFSCDGKHLAIAASNGFEEGKENSGSPDEHKIFIREMGESEAKPKSMQT